MEKHVYFVRHGESDSNANGIFRGEDALVTEVGKKQIALVAERVARVGVEAIIASPFLRTIETAQAVANLLNLPFETSELFIERRRPSTFKGKPYAEPHISKASKDIFEGYLADGHRHSDEENFADLKKRMLDSLSFLAKHPKSRICVATHGVFARILLAVVTAGTDTSGVDLQRALKTFVMDNTGITYLRFRSPAPYSHLLGTVLNEWQVISWNDSAHLG